VSCCCRSLFAYKQCHSFMAHAAVHCRPVAATDKVCSELQTGATVVCAHASQQQLHTC
jgi:hypothetical protein